MKVCEVVPVAVAGWLKVTGAQAVVMVVPPGTLGPVTVAPTNAALQPVIVAVVEPSVVVMFSVTLVFGGTLLAVQLALLTPTVPVIAPVHCATTEPGRTSNAGSSMKASPRAEALQRSAFAERAAFKEREDCRVMWRMEGALKGLI